MASTLALAAQAASFATSTEGHHLEPGGVLDYAISGVGAVIVLLVIYWAVSRFVRPGETGTEHIKRRVLEERP